MSIIKKEIENMLHKKGYAIKKILPRPSILFIKNKEEKDSLVGIEIGTFEGDNAESILKTLPIKRLYLVDPYKEYEAYKNDTAFNYLRSAELKARKKLRKFNNKIMWVKKNSAEALRDTPNNLDFVYIDGNHSYEFVKEDMKNYYKKLKIGGVLAGHDIENGIELNDGVTRAFVEFVNENHLKPYILYPDWWIVKEEK